MHLYCTNKAFKELKEINIPIVKTTKENIYTWIIDHKKIDQHDLYIFMNGRSGVFIILRYDQGDELNIDRKLLLELIDQVHTDIDVNPSLLIPYLFSLWNISISDNPREDHLYVIDHFMKNNLELIIRNMNPKTCFQRNMSKELNLRFRDEWAYDEYRRVLVDDFIWLDIIDNKLTNGL